MRFTLSAIFTTLALALGASAAGCDCFDYTKGSCTQWSSNLMNNDLVAHCKDSGIKTYGVCCDSCRECLFCFAHRGRD